MKETFWRFEIGVIQVQLLKQIHTIHRWAGAGMVQHSLSVLGESIASPASFLFILYISWLNMEGVLGAQG